MPSLLRAFYLPDVSLSALTILSATTCLERSLKLQAHLLSPQQNKITFPLWFSSFFFSWWEQGWGHPHHGNFGILWSGNGFSFPGSRVRRMCLSFLPPARRAAVQGCGTIQATLTHMAEWIYPLSGRENITAIRKQTAERLSNLPSIKDLVSGRALQLKTISLVSAECLSLKSIFLPLALINEGTCHLPSGWLPPGLLQSAAGFVPVYSLLC